MATGSLKVIYDFGAHNGDDLDYYLQKADRVVAVEANPLFCKLIRKRYASEIDQGRLVVEECAVVGESTTKQVVFYIHSGEAHTSTLIAPLSDHPNVESISVAGLTPTDLFARHGAPYYVKIDVESMDVEILKHLFSNGIRPPYLSAESHDAEVFALLLAVGGYKSFKLVDGSTVEKLYGDVRFVAQDGKIARHSFKGHSAGPFGNDIKGDWLTANALFQKLGYEHLGWKDIHASLLDEANPKIKISIWPSVRRSAALRIRRWLRA